MRAGIIAQIVAVAGYGAGNAAGRVPPFSLGVVFRELNAYSKGLIDLLLTQKQGPR